MTRLHGTTALAIAALAFAGTRGARADTFQQCGLTAMLCASAETQVRRLSSDGVNFNDRSLWVYPQKWTPWSFVFGLDGSVRIRYRLGGWYMWDGKGSPPGEGITWREDAETNWTEHDYQVAGCTGSIAAKQVVLHVPPARDITLLFDDNGTLVEVRDPGSMNHRLELVMRTVTVVHDMFEGGVATVKDYEYEEARNSSWLCPGMTVPSAAAGRTAKNGSSRAAGSPPAPSGAPNSGVTFEKARTTSGGQRDSTTGEQGGPGGAKEVFFRALNEQREDCDSNGNAEACRAAGIMFRHDRNRARALEYLDKGCKAGSQTACQQLQQMKH